MCNKNARDHIMVPISPGELLDKLTILAIKAERIVDPEKRANVLREQKILNDVAAKNIQRTVDIADAEARLADVNLALWEVEDALREDEKTAAFGPDFVARARSVYVLNDERARLKRRINKALGSWILEEKSYKDD